MKNLNIYCITIYDEHIQLIKDFDYLPVGLGNKIQSKYFIRDNTKIQMSKKNPYYGEYTFHYWLWKNGLNELEDKWIGFCQYRKYWSLKINNEEIKELSGFKKNILNHIPDEYSSCETILGEPLYVNQFRFSKFIKKNFKTMLKDPTLFFNKNKRTLRFHFNMMHGKDNLIKAINLLDISEKKDFEHYLDNSVSFNPHNMFICKSKVTLKNYYESVFPWLNKCESIFGFKDLQGYGMKRIYGFLAERYLSYWFLKNQKVKELPIFVKDLSDYKYL